MTPTDPLSRLSRTVHLVRAALAAVCLTVSGLALSGLAPLPALAGPISVAEAARHSGRSQEVEGIVSQVSRDRKSGTVFLNFGGRYPNHSFTAVLFRDDAGKFADLNWLAGRKVRISGRIEMYRGRPQIKLRDPAQITPMN